MPKEGPYRTFDPEAEAYQKMMLTLEKMEKEIAIEGKFSIHLPENIKVYDPVPLFEDALNNNINPKDIVFYSVMTGILKYSREEAEPPKTTSFYYSNPDNPSVELDIFLNKNSEESPYAKVFSLTTKAKVKHDKKINQEMKKEAGNKK